MRKFFYSLLAYLYLNLVAQKFADFMGYPFPADSMEVFCGVLIGLMVGLSSDYVDKELK